MVVIEWLDLHAGSVTAMATLVLVLVTGFYAWRTHVISQATANAAEAAKTQAEASVRMAEEMEESRAGQFLPIVTFGKIGISRFHPEQSQPFAFDEVPPHGNIQLPIRNAGVGPALELMVSAVHGTAKYVPNQRSYLAHDEELVITLERDQSTPDPENRPGITITAMYKDVFRNKYQSELSFKELKSDGSVYLNPTMNWKRIKS